MMKRGLLITVFCVLFLCGTGSSAAEQQEKVIIRAGVYVNRIDSFDIKTGQAVVDMWYWCISKKKEQNLSSLELCNGHLQPQLTESVKMEKDGLFYESQRYLATVYCKTDLKRFPFDMQNITLTFEDSNLTEEQMIFQPDRANSGYDKDFQMNEWDIHNISFSVKSYRYPMNFGYLDIPSGEGSNYSRYSVNLELIRRGGILQKLFKYFWAIFISVIVGMVGLFIRVNDLDARFGMAVGALFANVGCSYVLADKLPQSPVLTCAEVVSYVSLGMILLLLTESIISLALFNNEKVKASRYLDLCTFLITLATYCATCMWLVR